MDVANGVADGLSAGKIVIDMSSISPIATREFADRIKALGGDYVDVATLVPANADLHTYEVSPKQVTDLAGAALVVTTSGASPAADAAIEQAATGTVVDAAEIIDLLPAYASEDEHAEDEDAEDADHEDAEDEDADHEDGTTDPHTWLAIDQLPAVVSAVADALSAIDPDHAAEYTANAGDLDSRLAALDEAYRTGLATCERDTVVVTHPAFGYVTSPYGLTQVGVSGFDEDTEPSPARLAEISEIAQETGATTIFMANTSDPQVADALSTDLGIETAVLNTLATATDGEDYIALAEANLAALEAGLGCS